jgi:protein-S-isoprenylcysteine O-methyltransferase Ste14
MHMRTRRGTVGVSAIVAACLALAGVVAMLVGFSGGHRWLVFAGLVVAAAGVAIALLSVVLRPDE